MWSSAWLLKARHTCKPYHRPGQILPMVGPWMPSRKGLLNDPVTFVAVRLSGMHVGGGGGGMVSVRVVKLSLPKVTGPLSVAEVVQRP